jgi:hypothetical protein
MVSTVGPLSKLNPVSVDDCDVVATAGELTRSRVTGQGDTDHNNRVHVNARRSWLFIRATHWSKGPVAPSVATLILGGPEVGWELACVAGTVLCRQTQPSD